MSWETVASLGGVGVSILAPLTTRLGVPPMGAMTLSAAGAASGIAGAVGILLGGGAVSMAIVALVPFTGFFFFWLGHRKYPVMNDITTDPDDPPEYVAAGGLRPNRSRDLAYRTRNAAMQREHYPEVKPLRTRALPSVVFGVAKQAGADFGWHLHQVDDGARHFEAVSLTGQFRFRDDVCVRVRVVDDVTVVDVRAKARDGRADFGAGARRIADLLAAVRARLPADLEAD